MRTIPNILKYEDVLQDFHSPVDAHAHRINKKTGTKVHMIRDMHHKVKNGKKRYKFGVAEARLRAALLEAGV